MFTCKHLQFIIPQKSAVVNSFGIFYQKKRSFRRKKRLNSTLLYAESRQELSHIQKKRKNKGMHGKSGQSGGQSTQVGTGEPTDQMIPMIPTDRHSPLKRNGAETKMRRKGIKLERKGAKSWRTLLTFSKNFAIIC